jgi:hypothetical protein
MNKMKRNRLTLVLVIFAIMVGTTFSIINIYAEPKLQTKQGCQTEAADYLVDLIWVEFEIPFGIYGMTPIELDSFLTGLGLTGSFKAEMSGLILSGGTIVGSFGPCCFEGGPKKYVGPRDNTFPTGCCKSPDFDTYPLSYLGGGEGNPCMCQSGLKPTPNGRTYGGYINSLFDVIDLGGLPYLVVSQIGGEEWIAVPLPLSPP